MTNGIVFVGPTTVVATNYKIDLITLASWGFIAGTIAALEVLFGILSRVPPGMVSGTLVMLPALLVGNFGSASKEELFFVVLEGFGFWLIVKLILGFSFRSIASSVTYGLLNIATLSGLWIMSNDSFSNYLLERAFFFFYLAFAIGLGVVIARRGIPGRVKKSPIASAESVNPSSSQ